MILESLEGKIVINDCVLFYENSLVNTLIKTYGLQESYMYSHEVLVYIHVVQVKVLFILFSISPQRNE